MVIDTSAVFAILEREGEQHRLLEAMEAADSRRMSMATFVEASIVADRRRGAEGLRELDRLIARADIEIVPVDREQGQAARDAFSRFGKGRHRAALNYGDCFSYALAATLSEPLLCKGNDFIHTDIVVAGTISRSESE